MPKKLLISLAVFLVIIGLIFYFGKNPSSNYVGTSNEKIVVAASFYPIQHFTQKVVGDVAQVVTVTPMGVEPHDFEPTPQDIIRLRQSKVFFYNGAGVDAWAERAQTELTNVGVTVVALSQAVSLESNDPHFWLDPVRAAQEVALIRDTLANVDPAHADAYRANAAQYISELEKLNQEYQTSLATCQTRDVVVSHDAFGYPARRYGLTLYSIAGLSPEAEPSPQHLAELTEIVTQKKITTIFFETLATPKLAETLAAETGATTAVLNPIEGLIEADLKTSKNYDILMRENLSALRGALLCP